RRQRGRDLLGQLVAQHRSEQRDADGAADVAPELDLAGDDAEEPCIDRALRRVQIKRHAYTDAKPYEDEISDDLDLRRTDGLLREQHEADREDHGPNGRSEEHTSELQSREKLVC